MQVWTNFAGFNELAKQGCLAAYDTAGGCRVQKRTEKRKRKEEKGKEEKEIKRRRKASKAREKEYIADN